jgi:hypothetical protein
VEKRARRPAATPGVPCIAVPDTPLTVFVTPAATATSSCAAAASFAAAASAAIASSSASASAAAASSSASAAAASSDELSKATSASAAATDRALAWRASAGTLAAIEGERLSGSILAARHLCDTLAAYYERCPGPVVLDGTRSRCGCPVQRGVAPCHLSLASGLGPLLPEDARFAAAGRAPTPGDVQRFVFPKQRGQWGDAKPASQLLRLTGLLVTETSAKLTAGCKDTTAPGTLMGFRKRAIPLALPFAPEGLVEDDDARDRAAREAAVAAQRTVWTPARESALLAALAATPEYADGRRLPDSRWLEIAATLAEPGWTPHGIAAVKKHWRRHLFPRQIAGLPPPSTPATSRESRPRGWSPAGDAELLAAVRLLHGTHGLHMGRLEFWSAVAARCPSAPELIGGAVEHKHACNNYWQRYSAPVRRGPYAAIAPWVPPLECSLLPPSVTVAVDLVAALETRGAISAALYAMPERAAAVGGEEAAAAAAAVATAAADVGCEREAMAAWIGGVKLPRDRGMLRRAAQAGQATRRLDACEGVAATLLGALDAGGGGEGGPAGIDRLRSTLAIAFGVPGESIKSWRRTHRALAQSPALSRLAAETATDGPAALAREQGLGPDGLVLIAQLLVQHAAHAHAEATGDVGGSAEAALAIEALLGAAETATDADEKLEEVEDEELGDEGVAALDGTTEHTILVDEERVLLDTWRQRLPLATRKQLQDTRDELDAAEAEEALALQEALDEARRVMAGSAATAVRDAAARFRASDHPMVREGADARAIARCHRLQAVVHAVVVATRGAPAWHGTGSLTRPGGGMDASASDAVAILGARGVLYAEDGSMQHHDVVNGPVRLPRIGQTGDEMLATLAAVVGSATARVTSKADSAACSIANALASKSAPQAAQARVRTAANDVFVGTSARARHDSRPQAACSLLRNLRLPGGAGGRLSETELYRIWDVATSWYHATQTANVPAGSLVFVRQGVHGALSMMIVGGRSAACPDEFTILIRAC